MGGKILLVVTMVAFGCALGAESNVASRYQSILDRMPFGAEPEGFDPTKPPSEQKLAGAAAGGMTEEQRNAEAQKMLGAVKVSVINVTPDGRIAVGFTDGSEGKAVNYYLYVGQEKNGWKVVTANVTKETREVTLARAGIEATIKLGEGTGGTATAAGSKEKNGNRMVGMGLRGGVRNSPLAPGMSSPRRLSSLQERRLARQRAVEADQAAQAKAAEERKLREAEEQERNARASAEREEIKQQLQAVLEATTRQREASKDVKEEKSTSENGGNE